MTPRLLPAALALAMTAAPAAHAAASPLRLQVSEGRNLNLLHRDASSAAHLVLRDGADPRLLVAFPAGNSGVGAWFARTAQPVRWRLAGPVSSVVLRDRRGRALRGILAEVEVDAPTLAVDRVVVGSVRVLRDYEALHTAPAQLDAPPQPDGGGLTWARDRLDGAPGYRLSLVPANGATQLDAGRARFESRGGAPLRLRLTAVTGDPPLTAIDEGEALTAAAGRDGRARASLAFLSYREKLLAGSWRFLTYFGRDTLMSVRLLLPVLRPEEAEAGLGAVLARLSPTGEVAHEESIGEFAVMENLKAGRGKSDAPVYDYKMIDGDYMLAPVLAAYAERLGPERLRAFLARRAPDGSSYADLLARNLRHVADAARPFARAPSAATLIHLKPGVPVGEWRDSDTGLAGGRTPYDVNAVFVPAALEAAASLARAGNLGAGAPSAEEATRLAQAWRARAPGFFQTEVAASTARTDVARFAGELGVDPAAALASLPAGPLQFPALSLDAAGRPIPVLNSDVGFDLLFGRPDPRALEAMLAAVMRPFPAGLMTDVGLVVADAAYAPAEVRKAFGRTAYHGAVVWAWQEAVLIAGLDRQLARTDLPAPLRARLRQDRERLAAAVRAVGDTRTSELWSWAYAGGRYRVQAFGAAAGDADESNAAQLWSTVFLALPGLGAAEAPSR